METRKIEGGPPTGKDIQLEVTSTDYDTMVAQVARIRTHLDTMDHLIDQEDDRPLPGIEWQIDIDREQPGATRPVSARSATWSSWSPTAF